MGWRFWKKDTGSTGRKAQPATIVETAPKNSIQARYTQADLRRAILDWRDSHCELIELRLMNRLQALFSKIDQEIANASVKEFFFRRKKFLEERLEPIFHKWVEDEVTTLLAEAERDLQNITARSVRSNQKRSTLRPSEDHGHYLDAATSVATVFTGLAAIPTVAAISVVSAGGILGLLGVTTISWPILLTGGTISVGLLALGGNRTANIRARATKRYEHKVREFITTEVMGNREIPDCVCRRTQHEVESTAREILEGIQR
jgi:hypothetical protein